MANKPLSEGMCECAWDSFHLGLYYQISAVAFSGDGAWFKHTCSGPNHLGLAFIPDPDGPTTIQGSQATLNITVVQTKR